MLNYEKLPIYLYFKNGNTYSGSEGGMWYFLRQDKRPNPECPEDKKKMLSSLTACVWPEPWSVENTDPAKVTTAEFLASQDGLKLAFDWIVQQYTQRPEEWENIPSILDCEPWRPAPQPQEVPQDKAPW